ncbi:MAG: chemotaxis protein CheX [Campylobacter sp.]|nr:chemotaxis protein CheX [Campylobacter sp.]
MEVIKLGVEHLCSKILGYKVSEASTLNGEFYGSALPIYKGKSEFHFYLYFKKDTLNRFAKVLLGSDELNEDDLSDLCKEVANLIVGYSKNLLNERENGAYKLGTPEYLGRIENFKVKLEEKRIYKIKNRTFQIGYKRA